MRNPCEEWQQLCVRHKAERPEPVKSEAGGNELLKPEHKTLKIIAHTATL